ncbi:MAG: class I SAM-dependent methyltransferase [Chloroflexota bacterium]|nr:class I SAM-dependent methyltransferase [Chloroflexota bacterium]
MTTNVPDDNTYVFDAESTTELARLINQDAMTTRAIGGLFSGLVDEEIANLSRVLDLACGPGGWVLDVAFTFPNIEVAGIDISRTMVNYANARAHSQGLSNTSFGVMDITQPLDLATDSFDLVNVRFVGGVLPRTAWASFITECTRLLRHGGILRLTEAVDWGTSTSPAFEQMAALVNQAAWQLGYGFSPDGRTVGTTLLLPRLLRTAGYQHIQSKAHVLEQSVDTPAWADSYRNYEVAYSLLQPLLIKAGVITREDVERLYQQVLIEMHADDFCAMWHFMTTWGTKP